MPKFPQQWQSRAEKDGGDRSTAGAPHTTGADADGAALCCDAETVGRGPGLASGAARCGIGTRRAYIGFTRMLRNSTLLPGSWPWRANVPLPILRPANSSCFQPGGCVQSVVVLSLIFSTTWSPFTMMSYVNHSL